MAGQHDARELFEQFKSRGLARIEEAVEQAEWEGGLLDFKQNADKDGPKDSLTSESREQIGELVCAFANTRGGIIVWGIDAKEAKPRRYRPIPNVSKFVDSVEGQLSSLTEPSVTGVEHWVILLEPGATSGYAVTFIPQSAMMPHLCTAKKKINTFFIRSGAACEPMPYPYIRALFLARAQPELRLEVRNGGVTHIGKSGSARARQGFPYNSDVYEYTAEVWLVNAGEAIAEHVAVSVESSRIPNLKVSGSGGSRPLRTKFPGDGAGVPSELCNFPTESLLYPGCEQLAFRVGHQFPFEDYRNEDGMFVSKHKPLLRTALYASNFLTYQNVLLDESRFELPPSTANW